MSNLQTLFQTKQPAKQFQIKNLVIYRETIFPLLIITVLFSFRSLLQSITMVTIFLQIKNLI